MIPRKIVVVEDDPMTRGLLADTLDRAGFSVTTAASASDAHRAVKATDPDGVVLDIDLGAGPTGFDLADALLEQSPYLAVLFLTNLPDSRFAGRQEQSLPRDVGYLRKENLIEPGVLVETLDAVLRGQATRQHRNDLDPDRPLGGLSATQIGVLRMVALGKTNEQIALARGTTTRAVQFVLKRALLALNVPEDVDGTVRVLAARAYMRAAGVPVSES
jgi:DNA-binding NarL/FixJ family response regulator